MIQISHEIPISLLNKSKQFNDYDYCLVHLTYTRPEYQEFYKQSLKEGRKVLLDNSLFELETMFDADKFVEKILEINDINSPNFEYVVPDALHDKDATIESFKNFKAKYSNLPGKAIGVVHGKTLDELIECYKFMSEEADKIAIPFDAKGFEGKEIEDTDQHSYPEEFKRLLKACTGRISFIETLYKEGLWNNNKPHHLLGCSLAREFSYPLYRKVSIESIDTSNPVVAGIKGIMYTIIGLSTKPSVKLCDLIDYNPTQEELDIISYNVEMFRKIVNDSDVFFV